MRQWVSRAQNQLFWLPVQSITSAIFLQLNSLGGIRQKKVTKTKLTFAEFKLGNCRKHLCLSELDGYVWWRKAEVHKIFHTPWSWNRRPQACLYAPDAAFQVWVLYDRKNLALVCPLSPWEDQQEFLSGAVVSVVSLFSAIATFHLRFPCFCIPCPDLKLLARQSFYALCGLYTMYFPLSRLVWDGAQHMLCT